MESSLLNAVRRLTKGYDPKHLPPTYVGIDPGAQGAVAFLLARRNGRPEAFVADIPTLKVSRSARGGQKTEFDVVEIAGAFEVIRPFWQSLQFCLELSQVQVSKRMGTPLTAMRVGIGFGMWPLAVAMLGASQFHVHPQTWKAALGLRGKDKESSRALAMQLFPRADLRLKKHEGRAEALLIAEWYRRRCAGGN